jgi:signal transduction histidine kinase
MRVDILMLAAAGGFLAVIILSVVLALKMERIKELGNLVSRLKDSLNEMDEQAKLIVRTDMELNKTQEQLDKKVVGLYALQRLSRSISTTLDEQQTFKMIEASNIEELGFEKACAFFWDEGAREFSLQMAIGYEEDGAQGLASFVAQEKERLAQVISSQNALSCLGAKIKDRFTAEASRALQADSFIISPILPKDGKKGFLAVATSSRNALLNEGDEELVAILANQIGQALENARLFENTWRAQQGLEKKVDERTRELKTALEEVEQLSKRKTDFISSVSHELRTPLTSIKGYSSILLAGTLGEIPPAVRERLEKINSHSDELTRMVNDLLDIARIESGKVVMHKVPVSLKETAEKAADLLSMQIKAKNIEFSCAAAGIAEAFADRGQIERVFINLLSNAVKFTPAKGKIAVRATAAAGGIQVDVSDTGCGIPEEAQARLFEEFYRVDNPINEGVKGTGLGLALVKRIIEAHEGKIWVKSKPGSGTTFSFTLPRFSNPA